MQKHEGWTDRGWGILGFRHNDDLLHLSLLCICSWDVLHLFHHLLPPFYCQALSTIIYLKRHKLDYERNSTFLSYNFLLLTSVAATHLVQFAQSASICTFICRTKLQTCACAWFVYLLKWNCSLRYTAYIYLRMGLCKERESLKVWHWAPACHFHTCSLARVSLHCACFAIKIFAMLVCNNWDDYLGTFVATLSDRSTTFLFF